MRSRAVDHRLSYFARVLGGFAVTALLLGGVALRVTSCAPPPQPALGPPPPPPPPPAGLVRDCFAPEWERAARLNASSFKSLPWTPFGREETGWRIYAPLIAREIGVACPPDSSGFAQALAAWQARAGLPVDGLVSQATFVHMKGDLQGRRPIVLLAARGVCPAPAEERRLASARPKETFGDKTVMLRPAVLAAYRRMVAAARKEEPAIAEDPELLRIFSGYRSPTYDAARCESEQNCNGRERAVCSPHRTGLAVDLYLGHAPGFLADASDDENRLHLSRSAAYRWLVANADRFGFVNYPFEPWHWEWTGEAPKVTAGSGGVIRAAR